MDALALLCTLHADGPSTLKNLRQAGCATLEALESIEEGRLARLLGGPPAVARRFVREARHLRERLDTGALEREEAPAELASAANGANGAEPTTAPAAIARDPLDEVLESWRRRDSEAAPKARAEIIVAAPDVPAASDSDSDSDDPPPRPVRARPEFEFGTEITEAMRAITSAVAAEQPLADGLSALFEPGDAQLARRLGEEGCGDLRALTDADVLDLAQRLGFGYTRVLRVVQLARRAASGIEPGPAPRLSAAEMPRRGGPSILELEWNLEIRPTPPPADRPRPEIRAPDAQRESAGGPFA